MDSPGAPDYVSYLRKSKGRKAVKQQRTLTRLHVGKHQGRLLREFRDDDQTAFQKIDGPRPERDDFDAMLVMLRANPGLRVVAYHADRLLRNDEDTTSLIRTCGAGRNLVETTAGGTYDLSTANGRKRLRDDASAAIYEVDHLTERVLEGRAVVAAEGRWLGGKRPFGWELDPRPVDGDGESLLDEDGEPVRGILRLRPAEADPLRQAHHDVLAGKTTYRICREWNERGVLTSQAGKWAPSEVRRILLRARNAGLMEYRGQVTGPATWPGIVDEPTWRKVCAKLRDPERKTTPGPWRKHLLSFIAKCGVCGGPMICGGMAGTKAKARSAGPVYTCRNGTPGRHVSRDVAALDDFVTRLVLARLGREDARDLLKARNEGPDLAALYRNAEAIRVQMREQHQLQLDHLITLDMLRHGMTQLQAELAEVTRRTGQAEQDDVVAPMLRNPAAVWAGLDVDQRGAVIRAMMTITVMPSAKGRPPGWKPPQPGQPHRPYLRPESIVIDWKR